MSFVGVILFEDTVIGFGDSKTTDATGRHADTERGFVQKVFTDGKSIIVTCGANEFYDTPQSTVHIEQWINKYIDRHGTIAGMFDQLQESICAYPYNNAGPYNFIIGGCDEHGICAQSFSISNRNISIGPRGRSHPTKARAFVDGHAYYTNSIERHGLEQFVTDHGTEGIEDALAEYIAGMVRRAGSFGCYNPVGGDICVKTLHPDIPRRTPQKEGLI